MELKMKYHYSYFVYPYVIRENNYNKYIGRLLKDNKFKPKYFERRKNPNIYNFFLPSIRRYMFPSFDITDKNSKNNHLSFNSLRENMLRNNPCAIFEYNIGNNTQAKAGNEDGIFFKIEKIEIICFKTGICFFCMKTNIEDTNRFSDLLNFNVKFREINSKMYGSDEYKNIKIQTSTFGDIKKLSELIREITGSVEDAEKIDIDINRFLIYSYVCVDQEYWDEGKSFSEIQKEFFKFANVLNSEYNDNIDNEKMQISNLGKYTKIGVSRAGVALITSSISTLNYTKLPYTFENEYFYTYIFTLYEKFYLAKIISEFSQIRKITKSTKEFIKFTNDIWVHELTNNDNGRIIFKGTKEAFELDNIYEMAKEQYDVAYKNLKMKNSDILNKIILVLLAVSILTNIVNFFNLYKLR